MAIKKKQAAAPVQQAVPTIQPSATNQRIENLGRNLEGKGKLILSVLGGIVVLAILGSLLYSWQSRKAGEAQAALGKAIEVNEAQVSASPIPNNPAPVYATEKERAEKAVAAFDDVSNKYGSPYKEKAQYFAAVNRLTLDRAAGLQDLENLTKNGNQEVASLAKFALAEAAAADGKLDQAVGLYNDLAKQQNAIIAPDTVNFALASIYEKQGKTAEAAGLYFNLAKSAREAKDLDGKPVTISQTARQAAQKLEKLDAAKYAELPPESSPSLDS